MAQLEYAIGNTRHEFELVKVDTSVGRAEDCGLQILEDVKLSRFHFSVQRQTGGNYVLIDEHSKNGTFLNGRRVHHEEALLTDGDQIQAGNTVFTFRDKTMGRTTAVFHEVAGKMEEGKGFHTIMHEIIKKKP